MLVTAGVSKWRGMTLGDIATEMRQDALSAAIEVIRGGDPSIASFVMEQQDINALAIQPWVMTGSDGSEGHPRKYGTYPEAYRNFVVSESLMTVPQFVHRSAGLVADTFGLCDRGYLEEGRNADVIVVDLQAYRPMADFESPTELARGVVHVFVNGVASVTDGKYTGARAGEVIDKQHLDCQSPSPAGP
jgi:N-acyl-D-aspartate/D-glutamate deacylase